MTSKITNFFTCFGLCLFCSLMATHYAHMKMPSQDRSFASQPKTVVMIYDSSWKL